ncbi:MAG: hypothetical protein MHM6MM_009322 [Cercozoa sp. M6MM]
MRLLRTLTSEARSSRIPSGPGLHRAVSPLSNSCSKRNLQPAVRCTVRRFACVSVRFAAVSEDDFAHERRLMAEYEARESAQKSNKQKKTQKTNADEVYAPEQYEETGDQAFEEFQLRLSRDPEQCVRYDYAGLPLYAARRKPKQIPRCSCGKRRVFEMQLMPNIVNELKPWKLAADKAGFSLTTAAIFTCSGNCGAGSLHDEFIFVQDI